MTMEIITSLEQLHNFTMPCVVSLGTFDGLHRGHMDVINTAKQEAQRTGAQLAVFTFSNHPFEWIRPFMVPTALFTDLQKQTILKNFGVDVLVDIPFNQQIADLSPDEFLKRLQPMQYSCLVVGENFTYGRLGQGTVYTLAASAKAMKFKLLVRSLVSDDGIIVSSTAIRRLISEGNVVAAAKMLGRNYAVEGIVVHGNERGRLLGYPTANLELETARIAVPQGGVYAVQVKVNNKLYGGMANIGKNPTFGDVEKPRLETNIFSFSQNIYGQQLEVQFVQRIRGEVKFSCVDKLVTQLEQDKKNCLSVLEKKFC